MNSRLVVSLLLSLYHRPGQPTHLAATNLVVHRKGDTAAAVNPSHILFVLGKDSHTDNESGQTINGKLPTMDQDKDCEWVQAGRRMKRMVVDVVGFYDEEKIMANILCQSLGYSNNDRHLSGGGCKVCFNYL